MDVFLLIALLKTPGEGGTVQIEYQSLTSCEAAGEMLAEQFEATASWTTDAGEIARPKALWTCLPAPAQR